MLSGAVQDSSPAPPLPLPRTGNRCSAGPYGFETHMKILVAPFDWGDASLPDIEVLLADTASHLNRLLRIPFIGVIVVIPAPPNAPPEVLYRSSQAEPFIIRLATRNCLWSQFAFQFSHEFCHVLSGYERLKGNPNGWFHESICELASIFSLQRMAEQWPTNPPYPCWADYAVNLGNYAQERLSRQEVQLSAGVTLQTWLSSREETLRQDPYQRSMNELVAYALLPIFESEPTGWNAVGKLPPSVANFTDYLSDWHSSVDPVDKPFVARLSEVFGHTIAA